MRKEVLRIANCSGFYGDRLSAAREMVEGGPIDVLTGDYLAELTMMILYKDRLKDPDAGYAKTFVRQMEDVLETCIRRGIKIVTNAGGLNPSGLARKVREIAERKALTVKIAYIEGDDLLPRLQQLQAAGVELRHMDKDIPLSALDKQILTANAYLGGWGIAEALRHGADVVICPRVTDAALVVGPAVWNFGWQRNDWDRLAGAIVAGHVIECGPQCTGGNYAFFREVPDIERIGFPIAEMLEDGSCIITKHPGTGGLVSVGTVTAQLLYEIQGPRYFNPDATARFDTIQLEQVGPDRVRISGVKGEPPPPTTKVCINYLGGYRNSVTFVLTGLDIEEKAALAERTLWHLVGGKEQFAEVHVQLYRWDRPNPRSNEEAFAHLTISVKDPDASKVGRAFTNKAIELALANYPGFFVTHPPTDATAYGVYWPALVPSEAVSCEVVLETTRLAVPAPEVPPRFQPCAAPSVALPTPPSGATVAVPLGLLAGARSGDKGGNANVGVWAREPRAYSWLREFLTLERFQQLVPESRPLRVERYEFPNLLSLNFIVCGLLGDGVAASTRLDPQAKSLGEYLRAKVVEVPKALLETAGLQQT